VQRSYDIRTVVWIRTTYMYGCMDLYNRFLSFHFSCRSVSEVFLLTIQLLVLQFVEVSL